MNESKSLKEVWEWKEKIYLDTKGMTKEEILKYFSENANKAISQMGMKKKEVKKNVYKLVVN